MVYEPREDSYLLEKAVKKYAFGKCLDIGTGSGIQAKAALSKGDFVIALDIDSEAVEESRKMLASSNAFCAISDLFGFFHGLKNKKFKNYALKQVKSRKIRNFLAKSEWKFDTIIFNPPYLPEDVRVKDITLDGGKKGYEALEKFFAKASQFLSKDGIILIVFSSLTNRQKVDEIIRNNLLEFEQLSAQRIFFEELFVYKVTKIAMLKELEKKGVSDIKYLARGRRGVVFTGLLRNKKIAIKAKKKESMAIGRIQNEANYLRLLNRKGIGPKFLFAGEGYLCYEFVEGKFIVDYLEKCSRQQAARVLRQVLQQLYKLDRLKIDKEEMHHPVKHIIVARKPVMIDFERCHKTPAPKNVTQFLQFLGSGHVSKILRKKGIGITRRKTIALARKYKQDYSLKILSGSYGLRKLLG